MERGNSGLHSQVIAYDLLEGSGAGTMEDAHLGSTYHDSIIYVVHHLLERIICSESADIKFIRKSQFLLAERIGYGIGPRIGESGSRWLGSEGREPFLSLRTRHILQSTECYLTLHQSESYSSLFARESDDLSNSLLPNDTHKSPH